MTREEPRMMLRTIVIVRSSLIPNALASTVLASWEEQVPTPPFQSWWDRVSTMCIPNITTGLDYRMYVCMYEYMYPCLLFGRGVFVYKKKDSKKSKCGACETTPAGASTQAKLRVMGGWVDAANELYCVMGCDAMGCDIVM